MVSRVVVFGLFGAIAIAAVGWLLIQGEPTITPPTIPPPPPAETTPAEEPPTPPPASEPVVEKPSLVEPITEFKSRITKKPFGIYITPQNSPVQPEKFTGYHTAVDVEYEDVAGDVPVKAISSGQVVVSRTATGYGGVMVIEHDIKGDNILALYGHLDPKTMIASGTTVEKGQQIAILGDHKSQETSGERKHLHFGLLKKKTVDIRGYVQNQAELSDWYDPVTFF